MRIIARYIYILSLTKYNIVKGDKKMRDLKVVSDVRTQEELIEMKAVMEIFIVNTRIRELAHAA